jgi:hypothetical protein
LRPFFPATLNLPSSSTAVQRRPCLPAATQRLPCLRPGTSRAKRSVTRAARLSLKLIVALSP